MNKEKIIREFKKLVDSQDGSINMAVFTKDGELTVLSIYLDDDGLITIDVGEDHEDQDHA